MTDELTIRDELADGPYFKLRIGDTVTQSLHMAPIFRTIPDTFTTWRREWILFRLKVFPPGQWLDIGRPEGQGVEMCRPVTGGDHNQMCKFLVLDHETNTLIPVRNYSAVLKGGKEMFGFSVTRFQDKIRTGKDLRFKLVSNIDL